MSYKECKNCKGVWEDFFGEDYDTTDVLSDPELIFITGLSSESVFCCAIHDPDCASSMLDRMLPSFYRAFGTCLRCADERTAEASKLFIDFHNEAFEDEPYVFCSCVPCPHSGLDIKGLDTSLDRFMSKEYPNEFYAWLDMLGVCYDPSHPGYPDNGAKGVTVCPSWRESFAAFMEDAGPMPKESG